MNLAIRNANIHTMDPNIPNAQAVLILGGRIVAVGPNSLTESVNLPDITEIDALGRTVIPGFIESHTHPLLTGVRMNTSANCGTPPNRSIVDVLASLSEISDDSGIIRGHSFDDSLVSDDRHLHRLDLDEVSTSLPVVVSHISGHLTYANSAALKAAGVNADSPDPEGGVIDRDESGNPTGVFYESAGGLVQRLVPPPSLEDAVTGLEWASQRLLQVGVTSLHDVGSGRNHEATFEAYKVATDEGKFPVRTYLAAAYSAWAARYGELKAVPMLAKTGLRSGFGSDHLKAGILKIIHDGSLQGHSGAVTEGYHDHPHETGIQIWSQDTIDTVVEQALLSGWQVGTHGNGDRAIDSILDAYERALSKHPTNDHRFRVEHCQTVREDQLDRMADLGVAASFFNLHVYYWGDRHRDRFLGPERGHRISPLRSAQDRGILFGCHSDWWVTPVDPLFNIHVAANRSTRDGHVLGEDLTISADSALRSMTIDSAKLGFEEESKGSITVGKLGDLVVLSDDPVSVQSTKIDTIEVEQTIIGGNLLYDRSTGDTSRRDERNLRDPNNPEAYR